MLAEGALVGEAEADEDDEEDEEAMAESLQGKMVSRLAAGYASSGHGHGIGA